MSPKDEPLDPPPGCMEIPGYFMIVKGGEYVTVDGQITDDFKKRGVYDTIDALEDAKDRFLG